MPVSAQSSLINKAKGESSTNLTILADHNESQILALSDILVNNQQITKFTLSGNLSQKSFALSLDLAAQYNIEQLLIINKLPPNNIDILSNF